MEKKSSSALVIGSGIAGIRAAIELAENGVTVHLCESGLNMGGALFSMEKWFPDDACGMCRSLPFFAGCDSSVFCLRRGLVHRNINFIPAAKVRTLTGSAGDFHVSLELRPLMINREKCTACGLCEDICPVLVSVPPAEFFARNKAVGISNPAALRKVYSIDEKSCTKCGECVKVCPVRAIDLSPSPRVLELDAGAVIAATGFEVFDPSRAQQYGYGRYPNVLTNLELEYMLSGCTSPGLIRPSDKKPPRSVAFIQCVGSRETGSPYCSSACCMFAIKEAGMVRAALPDTKVAVFYMDIRAHGRHCEEYYLDAQQNQIHFVRGRTPAVRQNFSNHNLILSFMTDDGAASEESFDMVVLSPAKKPSADFAELAEILGIELNAYGFAKTALPAESSRSGVFACGLAAGPKDISETAAEACAAAEAAMRCIGESPEKTAVVICSCNGMLFEGGLLADYARTLADYVIELPYLCEKSGELERVLRESGAGRALVAACSIFSAAPQSFPIPLEFLNIREEAAWVHPPDDALLKAKRGIAMSLRFGAAAVPESFVNENALLVVGAGISGMEAALAAAARGIEVDLIEKTAETGGMAAAIRYSIDKSDMAAYVAGLQQRVSESPLIRLHTQTRLVSLDGFAGNFLCRVNGLDAESSINCGAVILATGAAEYVPTEYCFGMSPLVVTQREFEKKLAGGENISGPVIILQCVGSRNDEHKYCSRICCIQALKNAIKLKELRPDIPVFVVYRDIRAYGFNEDYYTRARELGVLFHPRSADTDVSVTEDGRLIVRFHDAALNASFEAEAGLLVLSAAMVAAGDASLIADITGTALAPDGFFREADPKFAPFDSVREGIFICGTACGPKTVMESAAYARAAAVRAAALLGKEKLSTGRMPVIVNARRCSSCGQCIASCTYSARFRDSGTGKVLVREILCQGCGACSAACPNGASSQSGFTSAQVFDVIDAALALE